MRLHFRRLHTWWLHLVANITAHIPTHSGILIWFYISALYSIATPPHVCLFIYDLWSIEIRTLLPGMLMRAWASIWTADLVKMWVECWRRRFRELLCVYISLYIPGLFTADSRVGSPSTLEQFRLKSLSYGPSVARSFMQLLQYCALLWCGSVFYEVSCFFLPNAFSFCSASREITMVNVFPPTNAAFCCSRSSQRSWISVNYSHWLPVLFWRFRSTNVLCITDSWQMSSSCREWQALRMDEIRRFFRAAIMGCRPPKRKTTRFEKSEWKLDLCYYTVNYGPFVC